MTNAYVVASFDCAITGPSFRLAEAFISRALPIVRRGVAILSRTVFVGGVSRYERMYAPHPPSKVAQLVERVPMALPSPTGAAKETGRP
jgi:hypothetical protein